MSTKIFIESKNIKVYPTASRNGVQHTDATGITTTTFYDPEAGYNTEAQITNLLKSYSSNFVISHERGEKWKIILGGHYFEFKEFLNSSNETSCWYACINLKSLESIDDEDNTKIDGKYLEYIKEDTETTQNNNLDILQSGKDKFHGLVITDTIIDSKKEEIYTISLKIWDEGKVPEESTCKLNTTEIWMNSKNIPNKPLNEHLEDIKKEFEEIDKNKQNKSTNLDKLSENNTNGFIFYEDGYKVATETYVYVDESEGKTDLSKGILYLKRKTIH